MILAGFIIKDKKVFSSYTSSMSLADKNIINLIQKFKPPKKVFDFKNDDSIFSTCESKSYLQSNNPSPISPDLYNGISLLSHKFRLYNNEFIILLILKQNCIKSSNISDIQTENISKSSSIKEIKNNSISAFKSDESDQFESLKSSPENFNKLNNIEENKLISNSTDQNCIEMENQCQNEDDLVHCVLQIKTEIVKHFYVRLEKGDVGLFYTQLLHQVLVFFFIINNLLEQN
jgi:hypothetical protein